MNPSSLRTPLLCFSLMALAACGGKDKAQQAPPPAAVSTVTIHPTNAPLVQDLVGRLGAYRTANVRARVSGLLLKRVYTEGSDVKQGQLLFQIDPQTYQAALDADLAALASAKAAYTNYHVIAERDRQLVTKGYVARQDMDTAEANERTGSAAVKQAQANVESARINLSYTRITSPIDGRAGQQQVTEGDLVGDSTSDGGAGSTLLTTVNQIDPLYVNFTVPVNELDQLRQAQKKGSVTLNQEGKSEVQLTLSDGSPVAEKGLLDFSAVTTDASTGAVTLRAIQPNPDHSMLPGQYVNLKLSMGEQHNVFLVPQAGIQRDSTGAYALTVGKDNKVVRKNVSADTLRGNNWIVTSGLSDGDQIIVDGVQGAAEGATVAPKPAQAEGASAQPAASSSSAQK